MRLIALMAVSAALTFAQVDTIQGERIRAHVKFLSSDLLEGRGPGQRGGHLAESYIAAQFAAAGLKPGAADGTFLQRVPLKVVEAAPGASLHAAKDGQTLELRWLEDFVGHSNLQQPKVSAEGEAVFVGHGIRAPEFGWDDYAGTDVKGKVVVLFTNEPPSADDRFFGGKALTYYGRWTYKYEEALRQGALAAVIVHTTPTAGYGYQVVKANGRPQPQVARQPGAPALAFAGWVTEASGEKLFGLAGKSVAEMLQLADAKGFKPVPLGIKVRIGMDYQVDDMQTYNVVGRVEGSDPQLKDEAVVFTAHWDHLGVGEAVNGDSIYNGALDNSTGTSMLVEMARAWASLEPKPRRTALFVAVTGEESGLLGSTYFAQNPPLPAARIAANLNFDSYSPLGRATQAVMIGSERSSFYSVVESVASRFKLKIMPDQRPEQGSYFRSDHFAFAKVGVPAFSVNMGPERAAPLSAALEAAAKRLSGSYHQPSDEYGEDWDFSGMEQFARFGFTLGLEVANLEKIPARLKP